MTRTMLYVLQLMNILTTDPSKVRRLLCVPFLHGFGAPLAVISALRSGHTTYVMRRFEEVQFLGSIERFSITETAMPPPLLIKFMAMPAEKLSMLKNLHLIWSGVGALTLKQNDKADVPQGAPMAAETQNDAVTMFAAGARICQVWGMTEGGWMTTFHYPEADYTGSVGRLIATYEAKYMVHHVYH